MPRHQHSLCLKPARNASQIADILSRLHFDFPAKNARQIVRDHIELFRNRGTQTALQTAQAMIEAGSKEGPTGEQSCRYCGKRIYSAGGIENKGALGWLHTGTGDARCELRATPLRYAETSFIIKPQPDRNIPTRA